MGAVLYYTACGRPPFVFGNGGASTTSEAHTIAAFARCVLQERPRPVLELNPTVSFVLSRVVDKLLEKSPFDRYKSAYGAMQDLSFAAALLGTAGGSAPTHPPAFVPGMSDLESVPDFSDTSDPASREAECASLRSAFDAALAGEAVVIHVHGPSGIGKSTLARFLLKQKPAESVLSPSQGLLNFDATSASTGLLVDTLSPLAPVHTDAGSSESKSQVVVECSESVTDSQQQAPEAGSETGSAGLSNGSSSGANTRVDRPVIRGATCCDKLHGQTPYYPITSAVSNALRLLMICSTVARTRFADKLLGMLGANIGIAMDAVPNLKYLIKATTPLSSAECASPVLSSEEVQIVVRQCLIDVITCLASIAKLLVLVIDDIQVHCVTDPVCWVCVSATAL